MRCCVNDRLVSSTNCVDESREMIQWYVGEVTKHHQVMKVVLFDRLRATLHEIHRLQI